MKKRVISFALMCAIASSSLLVYADNISESRDKLEDIEREKTELEEKLSVNNKEVESVDKEIQKLDEDMFQADKDLRVAESELADIKSNIKVVEGELEEAELELEDHKKALGSRLNVMYKNSSIDYIEVVLGATDIVDLFNRLHMVKSIVGYDVDIVEDMKENRRLILEKREELGNLKDESEKKVVVVETKKVELSKASEKKEEYMNELQAEGSIYEEAIESKEQESARVIQEIMAEEARIEAQRAAEREAEKEAENNSSQGSNGSNSSNSSGSGGSQPVAPPSNSSRMVAPTNAGRVSSEFGVDRGTHKHGGIDIALPIGTPIYASDSARVSRSYVSSSYGKVIFLNHGNGMITVYAHNSQLLVSQGESVSKGQIIAYSGNTGRSSGPHLHYEVVVNGVKQNPRNYVNF